MRILFCDSGFSPKEVEPMYLEEYEAAQKNRFPSSLLSFEEIQKGNFEPALKRVRPSETKEMGLYRGWMLKPDQYEMLYNLLLKKNIELINKPSQYRFCHYLPESYELIKEYTPLSTFKALKTEFKIEDFQNEIQVFGDKAIILKDYVKSQKHYWREACFIPDASDREQVEAVIKKFLALQGADLNEGLVFREYVELKKLAMHPESPMPWPLEFRVFVKNGKVMKVYPYWDEGDYQGLEADLESFADIIPQIKSNFFTMDIAQKKDGNWIIVELGDGQVAGLPDHANRHAFYEALNI